MHEIVINTPHATPSWHVIRTALKFCIKQLQDKKTLIIYNTNKKMKQKSYENILPLPQLFVCLVVGQ